MDVGLARQATHIWSEPKAMLEHMPRSGIQAKFYEMTEDEVEYSIPYDEVIPVLIEGGFDGYLSSEYEGNRHIQDAFPVDSVEQVRRQHAMFARLLGERGADRVRQVHRLRRAFRATDAGGVVEVRMPYYRGLTLSMVEAVDLVLDGEPCRRSTTFTVHGNTYTFDQLPHTTDDRWEMGKRAQLAFETDEPLAAGEHDVTVVVRLRISYMPVPGGGRDSKRLTLAA